MSARRVSSPRTQSSSPPDWQGLARHWHSIAMQRSGTTAAPAARTAPANPVETARAQGRSEAAAEVREITTLCQAAGQPHRAAAFLLAGLSPARAWRELMGVRTGSESLGPARVTAEEIERGWDDAFAEVRRTGGTIREVF